MSNLSSDEDKYRALVWIIEARKRQRQSNNNRVRIFKYPSEEQINFEAESIMDLVDWESLPYSYITPPPLLQDWTDENLIEAYQSKRSLDTPKLLCHSQGPFYHQHTYILNR